MFNILCNNYNNNNYYYHHHYYYQEVFCVCHLYHKRYPISCN